MSTPSSGLAETTDSNTSVAEWDAEFQEWVRFQVYRRPEIKEMMGGWGWSWNIAQPFQDISFFNSRRDVFFLLVHTFPGGSFDGWWLREYEKERARQVDRGKVGGSPAKVATGTHRNKNPMEPGEGAGSRGLAKHVVPPKGTAFTTRGARRTSPRGLGKQRMKRQLSLPLGGKSSGSKSS